MVTRTECNFKSKETEILTDLKSREERHKDETVSLLYSSWSCVLPKSESGQNECLHKLGVSGSSLPNVPHLENCKVKTQLYDRLDKRTGNHSFPPWTSWKGLLDTNPVAATTEHVKILRHQAVSDGAYPPWVCFLIITLLRIMDMDTLTYYFPTFWYPYFKNLMSFLDYFDVLSILGNYYHINFVFKED